VLRILDATADGRMPKGSLLEGPDGMLYGITSVGGTYNSGTIFKISTSGNYNVLHHMNIVTDGGNALGSLIFAPINNLVANAQTVNVNEDASANITLTGSGGSPLKYTITDKPNHGTLTGTAPNLTYKPYKNYNGKDNFSFAVKIGCITSDPAVVSINVKPKPDSPVLAPIGNQTATVNNLLTFTATATDADKGQTLKFSLITPPSGAKINATTGVFTWTPTTAGTYSFKVRVKDDGAPALYDEEKITVTVGSNLNASISGKALNIPSVLKANIYPNPADDILHIRFPSAVSHLTVRIFDMKGTLVSGADFNDAEKTSCDIDVSKLSSGMYVVQLQSEQIHETLKFMKN
jgi:uncharacterized repeat protein (TIGR03803 family)